MGGVEEANGECISRVTRGCRRGNLHRPNDLVMDDQVWDRMVGWMVLRTLWVGWHWKRVGNIFSSCWANRKHCLNALGGNGEPKRTQHHLKMQGLLFSLGPFDSRPEDLCLCLAPSQQMMPWTQSHNCPQTNLTNVCGFYSTSFSPFRKHHPSNMVYQYRQHTHTRPILHLQEERAFTEKQGIAYSGLPKKAPTKH